MSVFRRLGSTASLFPLVLAGLLAGMSFWLEVATRPPSADNDGKSRHDPDYFVENFEVRRFDPEGALQHTLRSTLMRHYPDDDSTVVSLPDLIYHRTPPTHVRAREAHMDGKGEHVRLIDDVVITRGSIGDKPESILTTTRLDAYPDDEIAVTDVPVTITQGQSRVDGSTLQANNKTATYVLEGQVRGIFYKNSGVAVTSAPPPVDAAPSPTEHAPTAVARPKASATPKPKTAAKAQPKNQSKPQQPKTKPRPTPKA